MEKTIDRIVKASTLPLSIVIVGVGAADFSAMVCIARNILYCRAIDVDEQKLIINLTFDPLTV